MEGQEDYEWELSKENVQPIKKGRNVANLSAALQPLAGDLHAKIKEERQMFEAQIRSYSGDDPLEVWHGYIQWTEQNFPKGGKDSNMSTLLGRCVQLFTNEERYKNDPRYLDAWMKLAKFCVDVVEIFNYMHNNGIGVKLAAFYEAWAWELESLGNTKRADAIYRMAIETGAQPLDTLRKRHSEFQARVARKVASGSMETSSDDSQLEAERTTLGELKGRGKKQSVPSVRTAKAKPRGLDLGSGPSQGNAGQSFQVFSEVENVSNPVPESTGEYRHVPTRKSANRENDQAAGPWNQAKMPQRGRSNISTADISQNNKPGFAVHNDDEDQPMTTPRKVLPTMDSVLSEKKGKQRDPFQYIQHQQAAQGAADGNQVPMYRKREVYAGVSEFSFEELRAVKYFKEIKEKAAREAEMAAVKDQMAQQVKQLQDQMAQQQQQWLQQMQQQMAQQQQQQQQHWQQVMSQQMQMQRQDLLTMFELERKEWQEKLNAARTAQERDEVTRAQAAREEVFNQTLAEMGLGELPDAGPSAAPEEAMETMPQPPVVPLQQKSQGSVVPKQHSTPNDDALIPSQPAQRPQPSQPLPAVSNASLNMSSITPSNSHSFMSSGPPNTRSGEPTPDSSLMKSFRSSSRGSLTAPSPTVNTREAMAAVMGMFNQTMEMGNALGWGGNSKAEDIEMDANFLGSSKVPMVIMEEPDLEAKPSRTSLKLGGETTANKTPFAIHMDDDVDMAPAVNKLRIHEDQENFPAGQGANKGPLKSALKIYEDKPASAVPFEVTAMDCGVTFSKPIEDGEMSMNFPEDMTFAPGFSSTRNFTKEAAHLISTPFNSSADMAAFPAPPVSTIKPVTEKSNTTAPGASTLSQDASSLSQSQRGALFTVSVAGEQTQNTTDLDPNSKKLSPILETSENSTKSSGAASTIGTASRLQSTAGETMHHHTTHMGASVHAPEQCPDVSKMPPPPQKVLNFTASLHHSAAPVESLLEDELLDIPDMVDISLPEPETEPSLHDTINHTCHEIDITNYFAEDKTVNLLSQSIMIDANNPFDEDRIKSFLGHLPQSLDTDPRYISIPEPMPLFRKYLTVQLGNKTYDLKEAIGQGAYAKVYKALPMVDDEQEDFVADDDAVVIKVQKPACPWEFYITTELAKRLRELSSDVDVRSSIMHIEEAYFFSNGSCLVNELHSNGTLLDLVNMFKQSHKRMPISCFLLVAIELLHLAEQMQRCDIIHGDIKPDNFLFRAFPMGKDPAQFLKGSTQCVKLIDFGRSIDMRMYPPGTTFTTNVTTSGFQCIEMRTDRPWTYQTDLFGIVGTMHVLLCGEYMKVNVDYKGVWKVTQSFKRYYLIGSLIARIFHDLLNIPACDEIPDVSIYRRELEDHFRDPKNLQLYASEAEKINLDLFMR